ncbi:hypothetical protein Daudx_1355 [Candidatus Desulforudis audaxviator]|nr:hypothetical protein Daudx_1355 [Candidatus Desulforudis audaxviator]
MRLSGDVDVQRTTPFLRYFSRKCRPQHYTICPEGKGVKNRNKENRCRARIDGVNRTESGGRFFAARRLYY